MLYRTAMTLVEHGALKTDLTNVAIRNTEFFDAAMIVGLFVFSSCLLKIQLAYVAVVGSFLYQFFIHFFLGGALR